MSGVNTDFQAEFDHNFDVSTVNSPQQKSKEEEAVAGKGKGGSSSDDEDTGVVGDQSTAAIYLVAMEAAYNTQVNDMMGKADQMEAQNEQAEQMSDAEAAVTSAELYASENGNSGSINMGTSTTGSAYSSGNTAYLTPAQYDMLSENGLNVSSGSTISANDISTLTSTMNDIEETYSGNSEYTLLEVQLDTQNMTQDSSMATSGLENIGDAQKAVAQNV